MGRSVESWSRATDTRRGVIGLTVTLGATFIAPPAGAQSQSQGSQPPTPTPAQRYELDLVSQDLLYDAASPVLGNPNGDVTVVEFFDYRCPYCKVMAPRLVTFIAKDRGLRLVMKEFPVLGPNSYIAARVALAVARHDKYQAFHEAMYALEGPFDEARVFEVVRSIGLEPASIAEEMKAPEIEAELRRNLALAHLIGVQGTPAFVIDRKIVPGAVSLEVLEKLIDAKRKKQPG